MTSPSPKKIALITGITGQDGSYLAELLLSKGYVVHGIVRRCSTFNTSRIDHIFDKIELHYGDLSDQTCLVSIVSKVKPDEIYNLAAQSHVAVSFELPELTSNVDALGTLRLLEAIRIAGLSKTTRFYQASTSELYGNAISSDDCKSVAGVASVASVASAASATPMLSAQNEETPFNPQSPYAIAKQYAYWIVKHYRAAYGMFAVNGILFNHESPRRGPTFVTRKTTRSVAKIASEIAAAKVAAADTTSASGSHVLTLGNLDAKRDWGHAKDYVEAMYLMLQAKEPVDYVVATGITTTVREFVRKAFECAGIKIDFVGTGLDEIGVCRKTKHIFVRINKRYTRPTEVNLLLGDASKIKRDLGWTPKYDIDKLIQEMVAHDIQCTKSDII